MATPPAPLSTSAPSIRSGRNVSTRPMSACAMSIDTIAEPVNRTTSETRSRRRNLNSNPERVGSWKMTLSASWYARKKAEPPTTKETSPTTPKLA
jgi:hypothetical protein